MRVTTSREKPTTLINMINMGIIVQYGDPQATSDQDAREITSQHDFGMNILPGLVISKFLWWLLLSMIIGDVGTVQSSWNAHMELLTEPPKFDIRDRHWVIPHPFRRTRAGINSPQCQYPKFMICEVV
jgi:glucose-1-phosphate adenylyltransferase